MLMGVVMGLTCVVLAFVAIATGGPGAGMAYPVFLFGAIALTASVGDLRMIRARRARPICTSFVAHVFRNVHCVRGVFPRLGRIEVFPKPCWRFPCCCRSSPICTAMAATHATIVSPRRWRRRT